MTRGDSQIDKLVLVVHGVGDPAPGETLSIFARSLADDKHPLGERQTTLWLYEKSADPNYVRTFPAHIRNLKNDVGNIELAEVFWGDISRVLRGWPGLILAIFQIVFGLRYVAYVAADQPGRSAYWLKRLGLYSSRILHGPVLAVTFFLAILAVAISGTQLMWPDSYKSVLWTQTVLAGCCVFALATSAIGWRVTNSRVLERFWFWVNVTAMFVGGLMTVKTMFLDVAFPEAATDEIRPGLLWYCRVLVLLLGSLWFAEIVVLFGIGASWFGALWHPRAHRPALHIAFLLPALAVGIWGQVLPMAWVSAKSGMQNLLDLKEIDSLFEEAIPLLGVQFLMCSILAASAAIIGFRFLSWRSKHGIEDFLRGARAPRLIVHGGVQSVLAVCTICGVLLVLTIGLLELRAHDHSANHFAKLLADSNRYVLSLLLPGSVIFAFLIPRLQPVFDIVLDVVNHFYFRSTKIDDALDDEDEFDINETTFEHGTLYFSRRDAIHLRMKRILSYYRDTIEHRPELIIVSHSQGTIIAIEVLNDPELDWLKNRFSKVSLVTLGSPLTNLYQHYFAHFYPPLDRPFWSRLRKRVDRWINIFRIDDPVGTEINFPNNMNVERSSSALNYTNHPVGCRGHVSYWNDGEVLAIMRSAFTADETADRGRRAA